MAKKKKKEKKTKTKKEQEQKSKSKETIDVQQNSSNSYVTSALPYEQHFALIQVDI